MDTMIDRSPPELDVATINASAGLDTPAFRRAIKGARHIKIDTILTAT
jgi:hypothetical protein